MMGKGPPYVQSCNAMDKSKQVEVNLPSLSVHVGQSSTEIIPYSKLRQAFCLTKPLPKSFPCIKKMTRDGSLGVGCSCLESSVPSDF